MNSRSTQARQGSQVCPDLVDRLLELYCDWRTECTEVPAAYERFSSAPACDRELAFAAYGAALDREQSAAELYAAQVRLVASLAGGSEVAQQPQITSRR